MAKRNLLKIPKTIIERIRAYDQDDVVIACVKFLRPEDISQYFHLGIAVENKNLIIPKPTVPNPSAGRYSKANVEGYEKVRKDLPMIQKVFESEVPNWGDWSNGSHTISWTRDVYQRDFYPPKEVELSITLLEEKNGRYIIRFAIDQVINRRTSNFEQELLYNLNILQENIGAANVFPSAASLAEYTATVQVDWQILPPGTIDEVVQKILRGKGRITSEQESVMKERISVMSKIKPEAYIAGTDSFLRYFGAKFGDNFVVFENIRYGNALYVMYDSWQELSRKSRIELLNSSRNKFDRIEHRDGWEVRLKGMVAEYRAKNKDSVD